MVNLTNPIFSDENKAREFLEAQRWPDGPVCPFCGQFETVKTTAAKSMGPGWYHCADCRKKFTVRVGTLYERSHIPLHKWLLATHLLASSKKGMSAHQLHRMLGITYKSAWFMAHRIREGMYAPIPEGGMGGPGKVIEADETFIGGKAKNRAYGPVPAKAAVVSLVERGGSVRSRHVADVSAKTLRTVIVTQANRKSALMTDEAHTYTKVGDEFASHSTVNHSVDQYVAMGGYAHTNTAEGYFSILKRGIYGVYHHVSEAHLQAYLTEFDFRYSNRKIDDATRAALALKGIGGKRLTYRRTDKAAHA